MRHGAVGLEREPTLRLVLGVDELDAELLLLVERVQDLLVLSALIDRDRLALEVFNLLDGGRLLDEEPVAGTASAR